VQKKYFSRVDDHFFSLRPNTNFEILKKSEENKKVIVKI
jgi:hypothetical protein